MDSKTRWMALAALAAFLLVLTLIVVSAAEPLELSPQQIQINAYPGEFIQQNISIQTPGNDAVFLSYYITGNSTPVGVNVSFETPLVIQHQRILPLTIAVAQDQEPASFIIRLEGWTEYDEIPQQRRGGGGSTGIFWNFNNASTAPQQPTTQDPSSGGSGANTQTDEEEPMEVELGKEELPEKKWQASQIKKLIVGSLIIGAILGAIWIFQRPAKLPSESDE